MTNAEVLGLIVPSAITVVGWLVGAAWAVSHVKRAARESHAYNRRLLREQYRRGLASELIADFRSVSDSIYVLRNHGHKLCRNMRLKDSTGGVEIPFDFSRQAMEILDAYADLSSQVFRLKAWLATTKKQLPTEQSIGKTVAFYEEHLADSVDIPKISQPWMGMQSWLLMLIAKQAVEIESVSKAWAAVSVRLLMMLEILAQGVSELNHALSSNEAVTN